WTRKPWTRRRAGGWPTSCAVAPRALTSRPRPDRPNASSGAPPNAPLTTPRRLARCPASPSTASCSGGGGLVGDRLGALLHDRQRSDRRNEQARSSPSGCAPSQPATRHQRGDHRYTRAIIIASVGAWLVTRCSSNVMPAAMVRKASAVDGRCWLSASAASVRAASLTTVASLGVRG